MFVAQQLHVYLIAHAHTIIKRSIDDHVPYYVSHKCDIPFLHAILPLIPCILQLAGEEMEIPELPANFVMDEFLKAREKSSLPKQGTVKGAASSWYQKHHD